MKKSSQDALGSIGEVEVRGRPWWFDWQAWACALVLSLVLSWSWDASASFAPYSQFVGYQGGNNVSRQGAIVGTCQGACDQVWGGGNATHFSGTCSPNGNNQIGNCLRNSDNVDLGNVWSTYQTTCPANSTLGGGVCTCNTGYNQSGSAPYVCNADPCLGTSGQTATYTQHVFWTLDLSDNPATATWVSGIAYPGATVSINGCGYTLGNTTSCYGYSNAPTKVYCDANAVGTGSSLSSSPSETPNTSNPCPPNYSYGTVNGIGRCLPSSGVAPSAVPPPTTTGQTNSCVDNGNGTTTCTKVTTSGNSTSTTTTITNNTTSQVISNNTTTAQSGPGGTKAGDTEQAQFCRDNPDSPMCKVSSWSGACPTFTCDGDAVQCAIAKEVHKRNCTMFETTTSLSDLGNAVAAGNDPSDSTMPWKSANIATQSMSGSVVSTKWLSSSAGAADKTVSVAGQSFVIPFSHWNSVLQIMGAIVLAFSFLAAARIVSGSVRG